MDEQTQLSVVDEKQADPIVMMIERACTDPNFDVDKLQKMLEMKERHEATLAQKAFAEAMANTQREVPRIVADRFNSQTNSKYPSAASVQNAIKRTASEHGLSWFVDEGERPQDGMINVRVTVQHRGGHKEVYTRWGAIDNKGPKGTANKTDVQGSQATVTYLSRRMLCQIFGVIVLEDIKEDLDGNMPTNYMTDKQAAELDEMLDACDALDTGYRQRIIDWMTEAIKCDSFTACPASRYNDLKTTFVKKLKKDGGK